MDEIRSRVSYRGQNLCQISNIIIILQIKCFMVEIFLVIDKREKYKRAI